MKRKDKIKELIKKGKGYATIGRMFGISRQRVYQIHRGNKDNKFFDRLRREATHCKECKNKKTALKPIGVHHIDKNPRNNNINNLIILCQSCHAKLHKLTDNMGRKTIWEKDKYKSYKVKLHIENSEKFDMILKVKNITAQDFFTKCVKKELN